MKVLGKKEVIEKTNLSASTLWRRQKAGDFPKRQPLSDGRVGWLEEDINNWIRARFSKTEGAA